VADFSISIASPNEGQQVTFNSTSTFPFNQIVSWSWDLGDGTIVERTDGSPVTHTYMDNGTYQVSLTVRDEDGNINTFSRTVTVKDTSPVVSMLYTVGGGTSVKEWDEVVLEAVATAQWDDVVRYQWDFQTVTFQADEETDVNTTSHRYNSSGTYRITVRAWDSDSYSDLYIQITITDPAPVPDFTFATNNINRTVSFSASLTIDTHNDRPLLEYRWFFGDNEETSWSHNDRVNHTYAHDGIYSVRLEVRDGTNPAKMKTENVTIDLLPPDISMDEPVLKAVVGEPTLIRVTVTDLVGIDGVILEYTIDNVTHTIVRTSEGGGIYFAQIPAQNRTMELTYRIVAEDKAGHTATTEQFTLTLEYEDPSLFLYTSLALLMAFLVIIIYLFLSRPIIDEVFVMYHDGTLLAHQTRRLKPGMDDEILGGMLIALQNFVRDSFKDESSTVLRRMDFGERKLLVERKDDFFMAVVLSGKRAGNAAQRMLRVLDNIEEGYAPVLREWDGDLEKVRGIRDETKPMFSRANPLDRLKRKEGEDDSL
jgi:PKD repeat protein